MADVDLDTGIYGYGCMDILINKTLPECEEIIKTKRIVSDGESFMFDLNCLYLQCLQEPR